MPAPLDSHGSVDGAEFAPGALLADRYRIVALLGRGSMGEVYRADDLRLGQPVALKFLPRSLERDAGRLERFLGEVRTASHPNVCRVYDIGEIGGRHFLSMEYVDGEDLAALLRRIGRLPADKAVDIARQLCAALAAAHDKGVLHRDLKPANVMLDGRGKVRLTDFGLAGTVGAGESDMTGTPAYMAPEQFAGRAATVQSDIYALGLVLYELFSGKRAFEAPTIAELRRLHEESHAEQLTSSVRDLDPAVERVIFRCLEKDPGSRPASAIAVAAALPGGDPLAAALAAGETPSPEMVAAAGDAGGMRPAMAVVWLAAVLVGLFAVLMMATGNSALSKLALSDPPDVTLFKAREMLGRLGYTGAAADSAFGYQWDNGFIEWVVAHDRTAHRWDTLAKGHVLLQSWHRTSPEPLVPMRFLGGRLIEGGNVRQSDPPRDVTGMTLIVVDARGRLLHLEAVPPQLEPETPGAAISIDWTRVLAETGIDPATLAPTAPRWVPAVYADQRAAWTGRYPDMPELPLRIEAAAARGKVVSLRVVLPWSKPERQPAPVSTSAAATEILSIAILVAVIIGAMVFARRNLLLGRGDRKGATRLAAVIATIVMAALLLEGHHVAAVDEIVVLLRAVCWSLFGAAFVWTLYLALEPPIRRRWPRTLIGWNRLLTGRLTDPLVGRDVLVGAAAGTAISLVAYAQDFVGRWSTGLPPTPNLGLVGPLSGVAISVSWLLLTLYDAIFSALAVFFLVFLLRLVLRKDWLAAGAWAAIAIGQNVLASPNPWTTAVVAALVVSAMVVVLFRFGIMSFSVATFFMAALTEFPLTGDVTAWYGTGSVVVLVALVGIAGYGFRTASAGKPLLGAAAD
jgi:serine/threonine-protein kinase